MEMTQQTLEAIWRACGFIAVFLLTVGGMIEPEPAAWVSASAGAFLAIAIGRDATIPQMIWHLAIGTLVGIAFAALFAWKFGTPRSPVAFLLGFFGFDLATWIRAKVKDGTWIDTIASAISQIFARRK